MNGRGEYASGAGRAVVGATLLHVLELKQRYENVKAAAAQSLLNDLSRDGTLSSTASNRWEVALKNAAWVRVAWYPDFAGLEITITDRELWKAGDVASVQRRYTAILDRITSTLNKFGATSVGATVIGSVPHVGLTLFHTPGDSDRATREIDTQLNALFDDVYRAMGVDRGDLKSPFSLKESERIIYRGSDQEKEQLATWMDKVKAARAKARQSPHWAFWDSTVSPLQEEWQRFRGEQEYFFLNLFTAWEEYERWLNRIKQIRAEMKSRGIQLVSPDPIDLTKSIPERAVEGAADVFKDVTKILKWGLIGALGIGSLVALTSVVSNVRKSRDPAERYLDVIRESRRPPAPRGQLALPPGASEEI